MALLNLRIVNCRLAPAGCLFRSIYCTRVQQVTLKVTSVPKEKDETFIQRNERLGRPISPHLSIYKPQLTSLLSLTHRTTGMILSMVIYGVGIGALALPSSIPHYVDWIANLHLNAGFLYVAKVGLSFPLTYHYFNGIRHLAWDWGMGFKIKDLYTSGYTVVGVSLVMALILASL